MTAALGLVGRTAIRSWRIARFAAYFGYEFLKSNALVLWEIVTPTTHATPALLKVPVRSRSMVEIVSIGNLVNLTPGTLTIELTLDPPTLYVHGMFVRDPEAFTADLLRLEQQMLAAMRPVTGGDR